MQVPEKELRVSSLYRMFYMFFPVITLTTNVAAVFSALIGERWMGWDQNWGIFLLLLSEALMPFSWMGSGEQPQVHGDLSQCRADNKMAQ